MPKEPVTIIKLGGEGGFVEILQDQDNYIYHSNDSTLKDFLPEDEWDDIDFEKNETFPTLRDAIGRINIELLTHGRILYTNPEYVVDVRVAIHERIKNM